MATLRELLAAGGQSPGANLLNLVQPQLPASAQKAPSALDLVTPQLPAAAQKAPNALDLVSPQLPASLRAAPQATDLVTPQLPQSLQAPVDVPLTPEQQVLRDALTHETPQQPRTTLQEDIGSLLERPGIQSAIEGVKDFGKGAAAPFTDGLPALGRELGSRAFDILNPQGGTPAIVEGEGQPKVVDEVPALEDAPKPKEAKPAPTPLVNEQGEPDTDKIAAASLDEKSFADSFQSFFADKDVSTMSMAIGVSLLQGKGIGDAIAVGMQALGKRQALEAAQGAAKRKESREERALKVDEKKQATNEKKVAAEIRKLNAEARKASKEAAGGGEKRVKNLTKLFEIVTQSAEGLDLTTGQAAKQAKVLLKQFEGTEDENTGLSSERVGAMKSVFQGLDKEARRAAAVQFRDMGIPVEEIIAAGK